MTTVKDYTFYNVDRIDNDSTCKTQESVQNMNYANYVTTNYFREYPSSFQLDFATSQPIIVPNSTFGGSGVGGSNIDVDSILHLKTEEERNLGKLQLNRRPFITVPYLGRGYADPVLELKLQEGETVSDLKSTSTVMSQTFLGYTLYPTSNKMNDHVQNAKYTVEEAALDGWVRGGSSTRELSDDPYLKQTHRPTNGSY
jgi:hypothetical protein